MCAHCLPFGRPEAQKPNKVTLDTAMGSSIHLDVLRTPNSQEKANVLRTHAVLAMLAGPALFGMQVAATRQEHSIRVRRSKVERARLPCRFSGRMIVSKFEMYRHARHGRALTAAANREAAVSGATWPSLRR